MINLFLKAKHWHLFVSTVGLIFIFQFFIMFHIMTQVVSNPDSFNPRMNDIFLFPMIFMLIVGFIIFGWIWSLAVGLQKKLPENATMKVRKFKIFFVIPIVYMFLFMGYMFLFNNFIDASIGSGVNPVIMFASFALIFPIHLFAMFCIFYCMYFAAKTIKTVELQKEVTFNDFAGDFFMIWFFPIGVWFIQPRINKIIQA